MRVWRKIEMKPAAGDYRRWAVCLALAVYVLNRLSFNSAFAQSQCELGFTDRNNLYNYTLASPIPKFPHGVLSEDGFYKVSGANGSILWFQLCDSMIFNHDQPRCFGCLDCGGPSHCGMACSALVVNKIEGYPVCTAIGYTSSMTIDVADKKNPHTGVSIRLSNTGSQLNCSLTVSVLCDLGGFQGPDRLEKVGTCDYVTSLRHPSGCAKIISINGNGFGWFGSLMLIIVCVFGAYLLAGVVYRSYFLRIRGIDVIPNLAFWGSLPHRIQGLFTYVLQKYRGHTESYTSSYSPVDF